MSDQEKRPSRQEIERAKDAEIASLKAQLALEARLAEGEWLLATFLDTGYMLDRAALRAWLAGAGKEGRPASMAQSRVSELEAEVVRLEGQIVANAREHADECRRHDAGMQNARRLSSAFLAAWHDGETNRGCYSQSDAHDSRCASSWDKPEPCNCGRVEIDKTAEELYAWLAAHPAPEQVVQEPAWFRGSIDEDLVRKIHSLTDAAYEAKEGSGDPEIIKRSEYLHPDGVCGDDSLWEDGDR
jgi:hypothetical protein